MEDRKKRILIRLSMARVQAYGFREEGKPEPPDVGPDSPFWVRAWHLAWLNERFPDHCVMCCPYRRHCGGRFASPRPSCSYCDCAEYEEERHALTGVST